MRLQDQTFSIVITRMIFPNSERLASERFLENRDHLIAIKTIFH